MSLCLALQGVSKYYGAGNARVIALQDVSFSVNSGEFVAIEGPSGSGKSSLLSICGLLDTADSGRYIFAGDDIASLSANARCQRRRDEIGFIFQRHQLIPAMTVYENIAYPLHLRGERKASIKTQVLPLLDKIGLAHRASHLPKQLSGGERQRVGIARALVKRPKLVIADEPSASLDHHNAQACLQLMRELNQQQGASFLIASHDAFVIKHCDRVLRLDDGRMAEVVHE